MDSAYLLHGSALWVERAVEQALRRSVFDHWRSTMTVTLSQTSRNRTRNKARCDGIVINQRHAATRDPNSEERNCGTHEQRRQKREREERRKAIDAVD